MTSGTAWTSIERVSPFFARHGARLLLVCGGAVTSAVITAIEPLVIKRLFDTFVRARGLEAALLPFAALAGMLLLAQGLGMALERLSWRIRVDVSGALLRAAIDRLHALPLSYHRDHGVGATITQIERGIASCMTAFADVVQLLPSLVYLGVSMTVMLRLDVRLSLVVAVLAPLPAVVGALAAREQVTREQGLLSRWTRVFARFNEVLSGITMIKSFAMEAREKRRLLSAIDEANAVALRGVAVDSRNNALKNALIALARIAALALGGTLVMRREITLGTLMAFIAYVAGVLQPVQRLTGMYQTVRRASVSLGSLLSILHAHKAATSEDPNARELDAVRGEIEFERVTFGYRPGIEVLRDIDLRVRPGETVALIGPGGTGKTTLVALLQRLYDPSSGTIRIDGHDLRALKPISLRKQIGVVLQETTLLNDTVRDNIAFGRPKASDEEIVAAARAAQVHDAIAALPDGYDTLVGERGCRLSVGERQRIAIARAILKNAPILVLDEALAGLDAGAVSELQDALAELARGKTTFVITDNVTTTRAADRIVVLENGVVTETGTPAELMRRGGYYAALVRRQMAALEIQAAA